mgnify:CR=1 FL=1
MYQQGVCRVKPFGKKGEKVPAGNFRLSAGIFISFIHFEFSQLVVGDAFYSEWFVLFSIGCRILSLFQPGLVSRVLVLRGGTKGSPLRCEADSLYCR